ncbi:hypothetical protein V1511DRAFT_506242 [Dipodascopsis uninucleata]
MSLVFSFALPTTGAFAFSECILSSSRYQLLSEADIHRARFRDVLKRAKRKNVQGMMEIVKAAEYYLPLLFAIRYGLENGDLYLEKEIISSWRLPLSGQSNIQKVVEAPRVEKPTIYFETSMTLLTYALALLALAEETCQHSSDSKEKWKQTTAYLLKGQSVLSYLASNPLQLGSPSDVPVDLLPSTLNPIINLISGSLHLLIIYKSFATSADSSQRMSSGLMSRVAIFGVEKFLAARALLAKPLQNDSLVNWLQNAKCFLAGVALRFMILDNEAKNEIGIAIAFCLRAKAELKTGTFSKSSPLKSLAGSIPSSPSLTSASTSLSLATAYGNSLAINVKLLRQDIEELEKNLRAQNDKLYFQLIPEVKQNSQLNNWPSGREVVSPNPSWIPPKSNLSWYHLDEAEGEEETGPSHQSGFTAVAQSSSTERPTMSSHTSYSGQGQYY